jgi:hypothetical protein
VTSPSFKLQLINASAASSSDQPSIDYDEVDFELSKPWCAELQQYLQLPAEDRLHCSLLVCAAAAYDGSEACRLLQLLLLPALQSGTKLNNSFVKQQRSYLQQALCVAIATAYTAAYTAGAQPLLLILKALRELDCSLSCKYTMTDEEGSAVSTLLSHLHAGIMMAQYSADEQMCSDLDVIACARNLALHTLQ